MVNNIHIKVKQQSGIALVMAIMIVALVVTIAVEMSWRFDLSIARTSNRWQSVQGQNYIDGVESLARFALKEDLDEDKESGDIYDGLDEPWAEGLPPVPTDHGMITGKIEDAQGRFNLNLLEGNEWQGTGAPHTDYTVHQRRFIRFLQTLNISEEEEPEESPLFLSEYEAIGITQAVIDWMDSDPTFDSVTGYGGAEADDYLQLDPPVVIANRNFISTTELRLIRGVTPIIYEKMLPFVVVLNEVGGSAAAPPPGGGGTRPPTGGTGTPGGTAPSTPGGSAAPGGTPAGTASVIGLNLNTMPYELIRSLNEIDVLQPLNNSDADRIFSQTNSGRIIDINDFFAAAADSVWPVRPGLPQGVDPNTDTVTARNLDVSGLQFNSDYFIVSAVTEVGEEIYRGKSLIYRDRSTGDSETLRKTSANF